MFIGGCILTSSSAVMYTIGKVFFEHKTQLLEKAPQLTQQSQDCQYGYVEGPLKAQGTIFHNDKQYVRLDESTYHITTTKFRQSEAIRNNDDKNRKWDKETEFVHRTIKQVSNININDIDIEKFMGDIPLKFIESRFKTIESYMPEEELDMYTTHITSSNVESECLLGEHESKVIGVELKISGIPEGKQYTIFGEYDANKNKIKQSCQHPNIVTRQSRQALIASHKKFARKWKFVSLVGMLLGSLVCAQQYLTTLETD